MLEQRRRGAGYRTADASCTVCNAFTMTRPPVASVLEPFDVAVWLDADIPWVMRAIAEEGLPVLGCYQQRRAVPLLSADEVRAWLRRPTLHDDET